MSRRRSPKPFRRAIVDYHRKEAPGSIMVDSDNHYLYFVLDGGKAIRYGITVGEEAHGVVRHRQGRQHDRVAGLASDARRDRAHRACRTSCPPGPDNPMGSRALYLYANGKDTLFRIHGTNQPEYIGASISSGCIRMTNEDVIDLYNRVKMGTIVVVLEPKHGDSPYNSKMALQGGGNPTDRSGIAIQSAGCPALFFGLSGACVVRHKRLRLVEELPQERRQIRGGVRPRPISLGHRTVRLRAFRLAARLAWLSARDRAALWFRGCGLAVGTAPLLRLAAAGRQRAVLPSATSRGGASAGRSAGSNGAIAGMGS